MARMIVAVLRGGTSNEYNLSLKTGAKMISALPEQEFEIRDIFIDRNGVWHVRGVPVEAPRALAQVDFVLNGLHGGVGEDGTVQRLLDRAGVPYAGSKAESSALALNKIRAREVLQKAGVRMPRAVSFTHGTRQNTADMAYAVSAQFGPPYIVKPASEGASWGIIFASTLIELPDAIADVLDQFGGAVVEEYIFGGEASVGILEDFRGEELYAFPPARAHLPAGAKFLPFNAHEQAHIRHDTPSNFSHEEKQAIADLARLAHKALGLSHFSRADIIIGRSGPYLLEVNSLPGLYPGASMPLMIEAVGSSVGEFLQHAIALARR